MAIRRRRCNRSVAVGPPTHGYTSAVAAPPALSRRLPRWSWIPIVVLAASAACTTDEPERTQPAPNVTTFEVGRFDDLPHPRRSDPVGSRTDEAGVVSRSYRVVGTGPEAVMEFYAGALPARGWVTTQPVERLGPGTYRGVWSADGHELTVSSSSATTLGQDDAAIELESQYSLSLRLLPG